MSIRIKFFLILLAFSLIPLLIITATSRQSITRLGDDLSGNARALLTATISRDMAQSARVSADAISHDVASLQLSLRYLADTVRNTLAMAEMPDHETVFRPEDYDNPVSAPPDVQMSWRYPRVTTGGVPMPSGISTRHPVVIVPHGQEQNLRPQVRRLQQLTSVFQNIYGQKSAGIHRVYVGLLNGLHISFPGHGHFPVGFDPRKRPWFIETIRKDSLAWLSHTDSLTQGVVFTIAVPIRNQDQQVIGVGAIDILPDEFMKMDQLRAKWSQDTRVFLVLPEKPTGADTTQLKIISRSDETPFINTAAKHDANYLDFFDADRHRSLVAAMRDADSGHVEAPYGGTPSIWAFARFQPPVDDALRIVLIVPQTVVAALSRQVGRNVLDQTHHIYRVTGLTAALLLVLVLLVGWIGTRKILTPLYTMVQAWERLSTGDFSVRINYQAGDERDTLIEAFNDIVPRLEAHWNLSQSMELAHQIQRNLLPTRAPELPGLDLAGDSRYCDETGGDYYDVFKTGSPGEKCFAVVVGDVSGHGVASALLMTTARAMIRSISILEPDTARRMTMVNRLLFPDTSDSGDFITLFYLEFDMAARRLRWVRAGHDPAILYDPVSDRFSELTGDGMALGIEEEYAFEARSAALGEPGQIIVIGTDGIWEAHNPIREMFGKERLRKVIRAHRHLSADAVRDAIFKAVSDFTGPHQDDDITLAVIKVL
jgi:sigma-B regulation protein RsbU (phosphoserine phosphatase)